MAPPRIQSGTGTLDAGGSCASTAIAPNFGFDYCLRRITPEQRDALDLSHWRLALNGAEPVRADTLDRFADYFAPPPDAAALAEASASFSSLRAPARMPGRA